MSEHKTDWPYVWKNAWRFQGGERWSREWDWPMKTFVAQSNARGAPRLFGIFLHLTGDALYEHVSAPLLRRGMRGSHMGTDAHPLSLTALAWRASMITNGWRWELYKHATRFARYNG